MNIMTAAEFDTVITNVGGIEALKAKLGYDFEVCDGREMGSDERPQASRRAEDARTRGHRFGPSRVLEV